MVLNRFLPIVDRELRVAARQKTTYWSRMLAAGVALCIFFLCGLACLREPVHVLGQALFYSVSALAGLICALAGSSVVDSVSSEKRDGTLGLLFLTNLSGFDVVTGKITAASLSAIYRLLAIIPILAITFLLGGTDMGTYLRVIAGCANLMFLSLAVGVYWSSRLASSWASALVWLATMVLLIMGWPMMLFVTASLLQGTQFAAVYFSVEFAPYWSSLLTPSPGFSAVMAVAPAQIIGPFRWTFWASLAVQHIIGWIIFAVACRRTQNTWRQQEQQTSRPKSCFGGRALISRLFHSLRWRQQPVREEQPVAWLVRRSRLGLNVTLVVFMLATVIYLLGIIYDPYDWTDEDVFPMVMAMMHLWLLAWTAGEAATWIHRDRRAGAMELLLATPLTIKEILKGHFQALNRKLMLPLLWVLLVDFLFMSFDDTDHSSYYDYNWFIDTYFVYIFWLSCIGMLFFNLYTLRWTATWLALIARNEFTAAIGSLVWLGLPTWGLLGGGAFTIAVMVETFQLPWLHELADGIEIWHFMLLWLTIATVNNLVLLWISRRECLRMRDYASLRAESGFWAQMKYVMGLFKPRTVPV